MKTNTTSSVKPGKNGYKILAHLLGLCGDVGCLDITARGVDRDLS